MDPLHARRASGRAGRGIAQSASGRAAYAYPDRLTDHRAGAARAAGDAAASRNATAAATTDRGRHTAPAAAGAYRLVTSRAVIRIGPGWMAGGSSVRALSGTAKAVSPGAITSTRVVLAKARTHNHRS